MNRDRKDVWWERRGAAIYTEGTRRRGSARLIADLHGHPNAVELAQTIVDQHNTALTANQRSVP